MRTPHLEPAAAEPPAKWLPAMASALAVTIVGTIVRAYGSLAADFPLNDGGLFYQMVLDLRSSWPLLPATTSYNGLESPFAYPPLGLYLGAALHALGLGIDTMRVVPLVLACLTVPAVYLLARAMIGGVMAPTAAAMVYALTPRSFEWLVMGGGLTRALGVFLAILAAWLTLRLVDRPTLGRSLAAGLLGGLTLLAHPQAAMLAATGCLLFVLARVRSRGAGSAIAVAGVAAVLVVVPWVVAVVSVHGLGPLISAGGTQPGILVGAFNLLSLDIGGSRISPVLGAFAIAGLMVSLVRGRWLLPAWFACVMVLDSRGGSIYAMVPASLLAGEAIMGLVLAPVWRPPLPPMRPSRFLRARPVGAVLTVLLFLAGLTDALGSQLSRSWPGVPLDEDQQASMAWLAEDGPDDARYLVVTGKPWAIDGAAEWFPVLTHARSVATVQGTEWLGAATFYEAVAASEELADCARLTQDCLEAWTEAWRVEWSHVYLPKGSVEGRLGPPDCCAALRATLSASADYRRIHDGPGATVFARVEASP